MILEVLSAKECLTLAIGTYDRDTYRHAHDLAATAREAAKQGKLRCFVSINVFDEYPKARHILEALGFQINSRSLASRPHTEISWREAR